METKLLIKRAKKGDKEALIELVMNKKDEYYKLAYVYLKNREDSLDALQDMIVILYENIHKLRKEESFYSWSKTILVNCCKRMLKENNNTLSFENADIHEFNEGYEDKDTRIMLDMYLSRLNPIHAEVIRLKYLLDLDYETISKILEIPIGTVKSRISNGMKILKEIAGGECKDG
ncbi:MAG TPA: sigma-70 family RNA polymerase sigma factor [Tissierellia bacterium]|nr:sigma-70 family RNA polymerase sigma factor [Tissierellia bacterium]